MSDIFSYINQEVSVRVDRPIGSVHPKYEFVYPINYGHLPDTVGRDDREIDVYILGVKEPLTGFFDGKCVAVIHRTDDNDDKLIVIPGELGDISDEEIRSATDFQEQHYNSAIIRSNDE